MQNVTFLVRGADKVAMAPTLAAVSTATDDPNNGVTEDFDAEKSGSAVAIPTNNNVLQDDKEIIGTANGDNLDGKGGNDAIHDRGGNDILAGDNGTDLVYGQGGNDSLTGAQDGDTIQGGADRDTIFGGSGNDSIHDDDSITGTSGDDRITGGFGADTFGFMTTEDRGDHIADFKLPGAAVASLTAVDANVTVAGDQAFL